MHLCGWMFSVLVSSTCTLHPCSLPRKGRAVFSSFSPNGDFNILWIFLSNSYRVLYFLCNCVCVCVCVSVCVSVSMATIVFYLFCSYFTIFVFCLGELFTGYRFLKCCVLICLYFSKCFFCNCKHALPCDVGLWWVEKNVLYLVFWSWFLSFPPSLCWPCW